jgi:hypothetical protein
MSSKTKRTRRDKLRRAEESRRHPAPKRLVESVPAGRRPALLASPAVRWLGPGVIGVAAFAMLWWSWRSWPDVLIDFGRELYVPWRLSAGQVLYTDIAYFNGPLAPYWNALWFRVFGASLSTLVASNLLVVLILGVLLYSILGEIGGRIGATAACLVFVLLFAFGQFLRVGNYNFVAPYSHDLTHGVLLSVVALFCLRRYHQRQQLVFVAAAGLAIGLLYLTKVEVFVAGATATVIGLGLTLLAERVNRRRLGALVGTFLAAATLPPAATLGLFSLAMPLGQALADALGHWRSASRPEITSLPFYRKGMGIDDIDASASALLLSAFWYTVILGPAAVVSLMLRGRGKHRIAAAGAAFVLVAGALGMRWRHIGWPDVARALPLFVSVLLLVWLVTFVRRLRRSEIDYPLILRLSVLTFSLVLLAKMILNARIYHYGFALAMPATLVLIVALVDWAPAAIDRLGGYGAVFRAAALAGLMVCTVVYLVVTGNEIRQRVVPVSSGADAFFADERGAVVNKAIEALRSRARPDQTLVVLPEGVMINYLTRHVNPTPYTVFIPVELAMYGEARMLASLQAHPPDYVMFVHRETEEYGVRYFGRDYARQIYTWIGQNFQPVTVIGALPFHGRFGILLMQRNAR